MAQEQSASEQNSSSSIDTNEAGAMFASLISPEPRDKEPSTAQAAQPEEKKPEAQAEGKDGKPLTEEEALERAAAEEANPEPESKEKSDEPVKVTVMVDGKPVELTPEEIAEHYKSGLRQADYTRKTTAAAEKAKAAEQAAQQAAQIVAQATQERAIYAQNLQAMSQRLAGVLQDQAQIDWQRLSVENPAEYVRQRHLFDSRQAETQRIQGEQLRIAQQHQAEQARQAEESQRAQAKALQDYTREQQEKLLAKRPEWKDGAKAEAEKASIAKYLESEGYAKEEIDGITDHRAVILADKARRYDMLMAKAKAATTKVEKLPARVERPGTATDTDPTDGRTAAMKRLEKSGDVMEAGRIFASMLS